MDVQALLRSKNRCLSQLIRLTEETLQAASSFSNLDELLPRFDHDRSRLFRAIELVDQEIRHAAQSTPRAGTDALVREQQDLLKNLQSLDTQLLESLESAIQSGQREIQQTLINREKLNRFKSQTGSESGEGLDQTL